MISGCWLLLLLQGLGCTSHEQAVTLRLLPKQGTSEIIIETPGEVGDLRLWLPEAIMSNNGACAVYPSGSQWYRQGAKLVQDIDPAQSIGPGNCPLVADRTFECCGIRFPYEGPVSWQAVAEVKHGQVYFRIKLKNESERPINKAAAAICLKFMNRQVWNDQYVFVLSDSEVRALRDIRGENGILNGFEAFLLRGQTYDNVFYHRAWGISPHTLDVPVMVSEFSAAGQCVGIEADRAYFLHSNKGNPCTDIAMAFGDLAPGASAESKGQVWIKTGQAAALLQSYRR